MKNRQKGQILIIFLLILVVGLALVLSVASRSITDIRLTTTSDESNRAYFAAEAGIEEALKRLQDPATSPNLEAELDFTSINQTTAKIKASPLITTLAYEFPSSVAKDEVVQISLLNDFNDDTSGSPMDTDGDGELDQGELEIFWGEEGSTPLVAATTPAILLTVLYQDSGGTFRLEKYAYDNVVGRNNKFCNVVDITSPPEPTNLNTGGFNFAFKVTVDLLIPDPCGLLTFTGIPVNGNPILARIRLLYNNDTAWPVAVKAVVRPGGWLLPNQGSEVESTGTTTSGVTRKLKVTQQYPALPSIFDYVLFSGGDLIK